MKFVYFTDLHAHNFPTCSVIGKDGVNSRLHDALNVIDQVCDYAVKRKIKTVVFGGDMFHDRKEIPVDVSSLVYKTWFKQASRGLDFHFLVGNHDKSASVPKENSLAPLSQVGTVYDKPDVADQVPAAIAFIPYMENAQELRYALKQFRDCQVIFMHQGVEGIDSRSGYVLSGQPLKRSDLRFAGPLIISGHIHEEQWVTRKSKRVLYYPGSCMQHDWGDARFKKYFHVFDLSVMNRYHPKAHKMIRTCVPRFVNLSLGQDAPEDKNVFVRYIATTPDDMKLARKFTAAVHGVRFVAQPVMSAGALDLPDDGGLKQGKPLVVEDLLFRYVAKQVKSRKKRARLVQLGKELLHAAAST